MAIVSENITLNDGSVFSFKYDDTPITKTGSSAYECAELKNNQYVAYQVESLNKMITATNRSVSGASFNSTETNAFLWDNTSGDWEINYSHFADLSYFGHTALLYEKEVSASNKTLHLITEIDVSRLVAHISWEKETYTPSTAAEQDPIDYYLINTNIIQCDIYDVARKNILGSFSIMPVTMNANGNSVYKYIRGNRYGSDESGNGVYADYSGDYVRNYNNSFRGTIDSSYYYNEGEIYLSLPPDFKINRRDASPINYYTKVNNDLSFAYRAGGRAGGGKLMYGYTIFTSENMALTMMALRGLAFYVEDKIYYPIINGGCVVGYTDKIEDSGDYQNYRGIHDHSVPSTRPTPTPSGDDHDNGDWALDYLSNVSVGGTVRYYLMTSEELLALNEAFDSARIGFNPIQSIISVMQVVVPQQTLGLLVRAVPSIYFRGWTITEGQDSGWTAPVATHFLSAQRMNVHIGSIEVPQLTKTFLDYEPYGSVEAYIPFCGWMKLPSKLVVGHTVTFSMSYDIRTCSCIVTAWCNGANIGQITGSIGTEIPMSTNGASIKKAALIQSSVDMISGTAMSTSGAVLGALSGSTPLMTAGMINTGASLIGGITQMALTNSQNFSMSIGNTGDNSRFYGGSRVVVRCVSGSFMIPDGFGDSTGYLVMKRMSLSSLRGFTIIDDPKINVACTDVERDMLREILTSGIVIN